MKFKFNLKFILYFMLVIFLITHVPKALNAGEVSFQKKDSTIDVLIDQQLFTTLHFGKDLPKPVFYPVYIDGEMVLREMVVGAKPGDAGYEKDHPHHTGIWMGIENLNSPSMKGAFFWTGKDPIINQEVTVSESTDKSKVTIQLKNLWQNQKGFKVFTETTNVTITDKRVMSFKINLQALEEDITFDDTKNGFFGTRISNDMTEKTNGLITTSTGKKTEKECFGQAAPWIDITGTRKRKTYGISLFDHPANFREGRYFARGYGLISINPFGPKELTLQHAEKLPAAPVTVKKGETLTLKYGLFFHAGSVEESKVQQMYEEFAKTK